MKTGSRSLAVLMFGVLILLAGTTATAAADDGWRFGIGTGFFALNLKGDQGFDTRLGSVTADVDLDNSDISDLTQSAFGFGGFAKTGNWQILYSLAHMELASDGSARGPHGFLKISADASLKIYKGEVDGVYTFYRTKRNAIGGLFGLMYSQQNWDAEISGAGKSINREIDESWVDGVVGLTYVFAITPKVLWSSRASAAYGGSDGTYYVKSGIDWIINKHWAVNLYASDNSVDYQNADEGDSDYYLYDMNEYGAGVGFAFMW